MRAAQRAPSRRPTLAAIVSRRGHFVRGRDSAHSESNLPPFLLSFNFLLRSIHIYKEVRYHLSLAWLRLAGVPRGGARLGVSELGLSGKGALLFAAHRPGPTARRLTLGGRAQFSWLHSRLVHFSAQLRGSTHSGQMS